MLRIVWARDGEVVVKLSPRESKALRVASIFGSPPDAKEKAPELVSARAKLHAAEAACAR